jgi:hypothetical protein
MLILDVGLSSFSEKYPATDVFYTNQNPTMDDDTVVFPVVMCAAKLVGNDVVVIKCTADESEMNGYNLIANNQRELIDDAVLAAINAI